LKTVKTKANYENPTVEVAYIALNDVIATSGTDTPVGSTGGNMDSDGGWEVN